ncbi:hypothetical protein, partial [Anaerobiospirillum succiniciproducens]|uniref:hypothetical protein n=1 Tax=Anaerobiospirillum succiniciproducens TaxID=13335 RepID=UPI00248F1AED
ATQAVFTQTSSIHATQAVFTQTSSIHATQAVFTQTSSIHATQAVFTQILINPRYPICLHLSVSHPFHLVI